MTLRIPRPLGQAEGFMPPRRGSCYLDEERTVARFSHMLLGLLPAGEGIQWVS